MLAGSLATRTITLRPKWLDPDQYPVAMTPAPRVLPKRAHRHSPPGATADPAQAAPRAERGLVRRQGDDLIA
jgi:hypothetical protein